MPIQTRPFDRQRRFSSERMSSKQEGQGTIRGRGTPPPQEPGTPPDGAGPQGQPQKRLNLVTLPADHRYLRGRY
jgi:hypothetical protein